MSYDAKVFNVMIASPSDVTPARNIARDVIHEWNIIHSATRRIVLLPIGWDTHSSPQMNEKPQELINKQVLDKCDLLVCIFWTRVGTETDEYASGTVEEIKRHIASNKPAMIYFSNTPVRPDSVDPIQYANLNKFKESCKNRGLYEIFDELSEFQSKFNRQLQLILNDNGFFSIPNLDQTNNAILGNTNPIIPELSNEAVALLREASQDTRGVIMYGRTLRSTTLQTNGKNMISSESRRDKAIWEAALAELIANELVIERGYKGELFEVTKKGYEIVDILDA